VPGYYQIAACGGFIGTVPRDDESETVSLDDCHQFEVDPPTVILFRKCPR
jgi:hypothetical protein